MLNKFFVYGTLKKGQWNDRAAFANNRIGCEEATIKGRIFAVASFPGVRLDEGGIVHGEVHTYPMNQVEDIVEAMDRLEGYHKDRREKDNHYNRRVVKATLASGEVVDVWVYEYTRRPDGRLEIASGKWSVGCHEPILKKIVNDAEMDSNSKE